MSNVGRPVTNRSEDDGIRWIRDEARKPDVAGDCHVRLGDRQGVHAGSEAPSGLNRSWRSSLTALAPRQPVIRERVHPSRGYDRPTHVPSASSISVRWVAA